MGVREVVALFRLPTDLERHRLSVNVRSAEGPLAR